MRIRRGKTNWLTIILSVMLVSGCVPFVNGIFGGDEPSASSTPTVTRTVTKIPTPLESSSTPVPTETEAETSTPTPSESSAKQGSALKTLEKLAIKGRAPKTGYDRDLFSDGWGSWNGCDWRNRILARDLVQIDFRDDCIVESGVLQDPYTGKNIAFVRGVQTSLAVQIDHVVAVSDAWQKGAQQLTSAERYSFYNDPLNLLAVDGPTNSAKGDGDAATWLPPNKGYRCQYVARQIAVKAKYKLWVTQAEYDAMRRVLSSCPEQNIPD